MKARLFVAVAISVGATALAAALAPHIGHGTIRAPGSEYGEEHEATQTIGGATCGVERWPVKTLADANKAQVSFVVHPGGRCTLTAGTSTATTGACPSPTIRGWPTSVQDGDDAPSPRSLENAV
jgi:hypothetical protein